MVVNDEFYYGKPWIDLSEQDLKKGLENIADNDVQKTSDVHVCT